MNYEKQYNSIRRLYEAKKQECETLKSENKQLKQKAKDEVARLSMIENYEQVLKYRIESAKKLSDDYKKQIEELRSLKSEYKRRMDSLLKQMKQ